MERTILVPLDASRPARESLGHASALARATSSELVLLYVVPPPVEVMSLTWSVSSAEALQRHHEAKLGLAHDYLQASAEVLRGERVRTHTEVLEGDPASAIVTRIYRDPSIRMVVMARNTGGAVPWLNRSVEQKVMRLCPVPLLLIPPHEGNAQASRLFEHAHATILVPLDGSLGAEQALSHAQSLASATRASLLLLSVVRSPYMRLGGAVALLGVGLDGVEVSQDSSATQLYEAQRYLWPVAATLAANGLQVNTRVVQGEASTEILRQAELSGAVLIVMSAPRQAGLQRLLLGGVAMHVVRAARLPVLIIPAQAE